MTPDAIADVLAKPISQELLGSDIPARLAYTGLDGARRVIPIAFHFDGRNMIVCTPTNAAKVKALTANPHVALTVDACPANGQWPPRVLLVRGTTDQQVVEGIPDVYIAASHKVTPESEWEAWEAGVRALYKQMVVITITPTWAKLLDFETTLPTAVEELITQAR
jgi:hypothetical protein